MENWLFYLQKYKFLTKCLYLFLGDTANQYRETIYIYNTDEIQKRHALARCAVFVRNAPLS